MRIHKKHVKPGYLALVAMFAFVLIGAGCQKQAEPSASSSMPVPGAEVEEKEVLDGSEVPEPEAPVEPGAGSAMPVPGTETPEMEVIRTFDITAKNYTFSMNEIRVKKGEKVKIVLKNEQGFHDWTVDAFQAKTAQISQGNTASIEFVADKVGTFEYYCSVGQHRQLGMKGNLVVE